MDIYFEQNITNESIDRKRKKAKVLTIVRFLLLGAGIVGLYITFMMVMLGDLSNGWMPVILTGIFGLLMCTPFILAFFFIGRFVSNSNLEYDYLLNNGMFRIVKVINRKKRKKMLELDISAVENIGKLESDNYDRYAQSKDVKKLYAICNYENEENIVYMYYSKEGTRYLLHIEPNEEMMIAIRRSVPRISIMDKSFSKTVKPMKADEKKSV